MKFNCNYSGKVNISFIGVWSKDKLLKYTWNRSLNILKADFFFVESVKNVKHRNQKRTRYVD